MKEYIRIKKAIRQPDLHGNHIVITMVGLYKKENGVEKWIKWLKLDDDLLETLLNTNFEVETRTQEIATPLF